MSKFDSASVPAIIDDIRTPPHRETVEPAESPDSTVGLVEIVAHLLMAMIIFFAMWRSADDVRNALIAAVLYFGLATTLRILARTHTLSAAWRYWLDYKLERYRIDVQADLADRHFDLLEAEARHRAPLPIAQTPHEAPAQNYVAPYRPEAIDEAVAYAESLYDASGYIDPRKVHASGRDKARIKGQVIGSKRGGGSQAAQQYLIDRGFLGVGRGGYWVNMQKFGSIVELARLRR